MLARRFDRVCLRAGWSRVICCHHLGRRALGIDPCRFARHPLAITLGSPVRSVGSSSSKVQGVTCSSNSSLLLEQLATKTEIRRWPWNAGPAPASGGKPSTRSSPSFPAGRLPAEPAVRGRESRAPGRPASRAGGCSMKSIVPAALFIARSTHSCGTPRRFCRAASSTSGKASIQSRDQCGRAVRPGRRNDDPPARRSTRRRVACRSSGCAARCAHLLQLEQLGADGVDPGSVDRGDPARAQVVGVSIRCNRPSQSVQISGPLPVGTRRGSSWADGGRGRWMPRRVARTGWVSEVGFEIAGGETTLERTLLRWLRAELRRVGERHRESPTSATACAKLRRR